MVLFSQEDVRRFHEKLKTDQSVLDGLRKGCERVVQHGIKIPKTGIATWGHYFACPDDATPLTYDYTNEFEYRCPKCGRVLSGEPYLGAWWIQTNGVNIAAAFNGALLWVLNGEEEYRALSERILTTFADNYPNYEMHGDIPYNHQGRMNSQTIDEATSFQRLAMAYDMIQDTLTPETRRHIEEDLFVPGAIVLRDNHADQIHNHEVIISAGLGMVGMAIGREDFIDCAINGSYGLKYQLEHALMDDDMWFEATFHYHFYALQSFMTYEKMAYGTPYSLLGMPQYRRMFKMALKALQPDFGMPPIGDGHAGRMFRELASHYEFIYRVYGDREFAEILNAIYAEYPREGMDAFLFGVDQIEPTGKPSLRDYHNDRGSGLTIMRGTRQNQYLLFRHGRFGGEHDHYDKLGLHFMVGDQYVLPDLSTVLYGAPAHYGYFKNTFTHNTVCINAQNQPPCNGHTVRYEQRNGETLVEGHADWCGQPPELDSFTICQWDDASYRGVTMNRTILHRDEYFLEAFRVRGAAGRQVDWIIHPRGICTEQAGSYQPVHLGDTEPIKYMKNARGMTEEGMAVSSWQSGAGRFNVYSACSAPSTIIYAEGPYNPTSEEMTYFIRRVEGEDDIVFVNIFELEQGENKIERPEIVISGGRATVRLNYGGEMREYVITVGEED